MPEDFLPADFTAFFGTVRFFIRPQVYKRSTKPSLVERLGFWGEIAFNGSGSWFRRTFRITCRAGCRLLRLIHRRADFLRNRREFVSRLLNRLDIVRLKRRLERLKLLLRSFLVRLRDFFTRFLQHLLRGVYPR